MSDDFTTDQAEREASGAHPYGRYLEEFEVGAVYKHWPAKTVTETEDHLFCLITMNHHPLHLNDVYAKASQQGRNVVVGPMVYSLALGMSVSDVSGKAIANLATEELKHPAPVFHGDTLFCESEVLEKRESKTKPDRGTVRVHTRVLNQDGVLVAEFKRLVLVPRKEHGDPGRARGNRRKTRSAAAEARRLRLVEPEVLAICEDFSLVGGRTFAYHSLDRQRAAGALRIRGRRMGECHGVREDGGRVRRSLVRRGARGRLRSCSVRGLESRCCRCLCARCPAPGDLPAAAVPATSPRRVVPPPAAVSPGRATCAPASLGR